MRVRGQTIAADPTSVKAVVMAVVRMVGTTTEANVQAGTAAANAVVMVRTEAAVTRDVPTVLQADSVQAPVAQVAATQVAMAIGPAMGPQAVMGIVLVAAAVGPRVAVEVVPKAAVTVVARKVGTAVDVPEADRAAAGWRLRLHLCRNQ